MAWAVTSHMPSPSALVARIESHGLHARDDLDDVPLDWPRLARLAALSRALDLLEETELVPAGRVAYQFSARGHELAQIIVGSMLDYPGDGVGVYYRSRALMLCLGLDPVDALAASLGRGGGLTDGRDIGVVFNRPSTGGPTVLPMTGDVGGQFTPAAGWAQAIQYRAEVLGEGDAAGAIAVAFGGDGSVATNGFWAALGMATTTPLPLLFVIEDNGLALSTPAERQIPGGNIARNLASFGNILILDGDGSDPESTARLARAAVRHVRHTRTPCLLRLAVPRLAGHSVHDAQAYRSASALEADHARDPLRRLASLLPAASAHGWPQIEAEARLQVQAALAIADRAAPPDPAAIATHLFASTEIAPAPRSHLVTDPGPRVNMITAITRTLDHALATDPRVMVFGQDVGAKGGVHGATRGLQVAHGEARVFDTSLSEEGIIGRAVGLALAGLRPVAEIQFRKYADAAAEQLRNCGTLRWRTAGRFTAPIVVRIPCGFARCGDLWHSLCDEVQLARALGWRVFFPANAEDAVGLLRTALRSDDPTIFLEHRWLLDAAPARRPYPGDDFALAAGRARFVRAGSDVTIVTWGAMVERCERAQSLTSTSLEILDLRTIAPWDHEAVLGSVARTRRCLIVHEDTLTAGFGAEIAATVSRAAFYDLDAPVDRLAVADLPLPYNAQLLAAVLPDAHASAARADALLKP